MFDSMHFVRPWWLLFILIALLLCWFISRSTTQSAWDKFIPKDKLKWLINGEYSTNHWISISLFIAWLIASIALSGPSWEKVPQPLGKSPDALIILFDLSPSTLATDLKPNRLKRAKLKVIDLLRKRKDGSTALIAYAGGAHTVSPLTTDSKTIIGLLNVLNPSLMPVAGSNTEAAVELANSLFKKSNVKHGHILLVTDGVAPSALRTISNLMKPNTLGNSQHRLSILGVGTTAGSPILNKDGSFVKDANNQVILATINRNELEVLAARHNGRYVGIQPNNSDINYLLNERFSAAFINKLNQRQQQPQGLDTLLQFNDWYDNGGQLVFLLLPLTLLLFRKNWLISVALVCGLSSPTPPAWAQDSQSGKAKFEGNKEATKNTQFSWWDKLWLNQNQRGKVLLDQTPQQAADQFQHPDWKAYSYFQSKDYEQALSLYSQSESTSNIQNRAKTEFMSSNYLAAINSFKKLADKAKKSNDKTLQKQAEDYQKLLKWLMEQAERQQQKQQQGKGDQEQEQQNQEQQGEGENQQGEEQGEGEEQGQQSSKEQEQNGDSQSAAGDEESEGNEDEKQALAKKGEDEDSTDEGNKQSTVQPSPEEAEQALKKMRMQRWLDTIVDDPGGLLRRKFQYQAQQEKNTIKSQRY